MSDRTRLVETLTEALRQRHPEIPPDVVADMVEFMVVMTLRSGYVIARRSGSV